MSEHSTCGTEHRSPRAKSTEKIFPENHGSPMTGSFDDEKDVLEFDREFSSSPAKAPNAIQKCDEKKIIEQLSRISIGAWDSDKGTPGENGHKNPVNSEYYEWLGLDVNATGAQVRKVYRELVLKCHPDRRLGSRIEEEEVGDFTKISEAYEVLSNKKYRFIYDTFGFKKSELSIFYGGIGRFIGDYLGVTHIEPLIGKMRLYYKVMDVVEGLILKSSEKYDGDIKCENKDKELMSDVIYDALKKHTSDKYDKFLEAPANLLKERLKLYTDHFYDGEDHFSIPNEECKNLIHQNAKMELRKKVKDDIEAISGKISPTILRTIGKVYSMEAESWLSCINNSEGFLSGRFFSLKNGIRNTFKMTSIKFTHVTKIVITILSLITDLCMLSRIDNNSPPSTVKITPPNPTSSLSFLHNIESSDVPNDSKELGRSNSDGEKIMMNTPDSKDDGARKKLLKSVLEETMELMSNACNLEALTTAKKICNSVLKDEALDPELVRLRCIALKVISEEYSAIDVPTLTMDLNF